MKYKIIFVLLIALSMSLQAKSSKKEQDLKSYDGKNTVKIYDYCTGEYMTIEIDNHSTVECKDINIVTIGPAEDKKKKVVMECDKGKEVTIDSYTGKVLKVYDHSTGQIMSINLDENDILECLGVKKVKKVKK
ncbi:MAG: hypothetical protein PHN38_08940 [Sulfurospirillaceae bacterium]|nr:hypothetical protein [Sulfurospirillaceae bacterium]